MKKIIAKGLQISIIKIGNEDYISLTDIARHKNSDEPKDVVKNWMRSKSTIEFLGLWEKINNQNFKGVEFDSFWQEAGANSFVLSPSKWIETTNAVGITSKSGRYGSGTFAHRDIAFEFASWISAEFKLYLIKEFQRLKIVESERFSLGWNAKRMLTKINYHIHTDAIIEHLIPKQISKTEANIIFATEADLINKALFGITAKEWREKNPKLVGNLRDYADVAQLICLANLESLNAELIRQKLTQSQRLLRLNEVAIIQLKSLLKNNTVKNLT
ncbi:MAG: KilA-N domain-containing protein [Rickettsiales bacterium]|nr:KilA-N domain-containing protein [Rickettsiales bacterium]